MRALRRALHRRRGADRPDAHRRDVGHHQARRRARHPGHRQGPLRRHLPDRRVRCSSERAAWLDEDGFGHISTFGGAELGCVVGASRCWRSASGPRSASTVHDIADFFGQRPARASRRAYPDWFVGIRQNGVVMGLEFDHPEGAKFVMRDLYENGVWAIFSTLDPARAAVQAGPPARPRAGRGGARPRRGRDRPGAAPRRAASADGGVSDERTTARREPPGVPARAHDARSAPDWAARAFAELDRGPSQRIVDAVAEAAYAQRRKGMPSGRSRRPASAWSSTR